MKTLNPIGASSMRPCLLNKLSVASHAAWPGAIAALHRSAQRSSWFEIQQPRIGLASGLLFIAMLSSFVGGLNAQERFVSKDKDMTSSIRGEDLFLDVPFSPLGISFSQSKRDVLFSNRYTQKVIRYQLGCVRSLKDVRASGSSPFVTTDLEPGKILINSTSLYTNDAQRCIQKEAKLAFVKVVFADNSSWQIDRPGPSSNGLSKRPSLVKRSSLRLRRIARGLVTALVGGENKESSERKVDPGVAVKLTGDVTESGRTARPYVMPSAPSVSKEAGRESKQRLGSVVGSAVFVDSITKEFVDNAPNVSIELISLKTILRVKSSETGILDEQLPVGSYCLKTAYGPDNKPLNFSPEQYKCFKIRSRDITRFDVMVLRWSPRAAQAPVSRKSERTVSTTQERGQPAEANTLLTLKGSVTRVGERGTRGIASGNIKAISDEEVMKLLLSGKPSEATAAVQEIMNRGERMIPFLANNKGKQSRFCGIEKLGYWGPGTIAIFSSTDPCMTTRDVTSEVASLFLINAIYYEDLGFAGPPVLCDRVFEPGGEHSGKCSNDAKRLRSAWASVERWLTAYRRDGLEALRKNHKDPLSDAKASFF